MLFRRRTEKRQNPVIAPAIINLTDLLNDKQNTRKIAAHLLPHLMITPITAPVDDPILTTTAAARLLGVAVSTTQLWLESGNYTIMAPQPFVVDDATRDARFAGNPLVTGAPHVRFCAGLPLLDAGRHPLGTVCVLDREPRRLREREFKALGEIAAIAVEERRRRS